MASLHIGPKHLIHGIKKPIFVRQSQGPSEEILSLREKISNLELQLKEERPEVIREIEVLKEVKVFEKEIIEIPVEVIREITVEKIIETPIEVIKEVIKEITVIEEKIIEKPIEVIKELEKFINKEIPVIPKWIWIIQAIEFLLIMFLLIHK